MNNISFFASIMALFSIAASAMDSTPKQVKMSDAIARVRARAASEKKAVVETVSELKSALTLREKRVQKMEEMKRLSDLVVRIKIDSK